MSSSSEGSPPPAEEEGNHSTIAQRDSYNPYVGTPKRLKVFDVNTSVFAISSDADGLYIDS